MIYRVVRPTAAALAHHGELGALVTALGAVTGVERAA
jgi:hypothetical protein